MKNYLCIAISILFLSGCASLVSISTSSIPKERDQKVSTEVSRWNVLGLVFDNDFVNPLNENLASQCPQGKVRGIKTQHEVLSYLLVWKETVKAEGYCVK